MTAAGATLMHGDVLDVLPGLAAGAAPWNRIEECEGAGALNRVTPIGKRPRCLFGQQVPPLSADRIRPLAPAMIPPRRRVSSD